ncbi:Gfo/Idh/MocA family oxidoreductase [Acidihalobacter ferrooxydans]|uniref:Oxidoreductase n=1 Tax=Acidihalobacter ferrooxydans TaxID=1765967 RepID=A0A1P8UGW0_9GAMM|nr:Gfo/Idh/MocA family oxidoreductase [Acidihalobacter ferrooxydans]APZ43076.1 oxidoreductase [Acidihalobacter ferrooxydans]
MSFQPPDALNVALIGYGLAGAVFHGPLIDSTPGLRLTHIVTSARERIRAAHAAHPQTTVVADVQTLWQNAYQLDLAVIATPNSTHATLARAAMDAGLHVVVDKPLATCSDEARALIAYADACGRRLTVFQNRRWDNDFLTLRSLIEQGELGDVYRYESRFERWRPQPKSGWRRSGAQTAAGGILFDLGSHLIDQALQLFGPAQRVYAELDPRYSESEVDDDSFVALTHASGVRSHLWMSSLAAQPGPRLRVLGSRSAYVKYGLDPQEAALRRGERPGVRDWGIEDEGNHGWLGSERERRRIPSLPGAYLQFYARLASALRYDAALPVDPRDALRVLEIIEAASRAHDQGMPIPL